MKRTKKVVTETFTHEFPNGIRYIEERTNGEFRSAQFRRTSKSKVLNKIFKDQRYIYSPRLKKSALLAPWGDILHNETMSDQWWVCPQIDVDTFDDWENVIYFGGSMDGMTWLITHDTPCSVPMRQDYISSFDDYEFDLDKVIAELKKRKNVWDVRKVKIPYYNQDIATHAVEFVAKLSQKLYDEIFEKNKKSDTYSCAFNRAIRSHSDIDPFNVQRFKIKDRYK